MARIGILLQKLFRTIVKKNVLLIKNFYSSFISIRPPYSKNKKIFKRACIFKVNEIVIVFKMKNQSRRIYEDVRKWKEFQISGLWCNMQPFYYCFLYIYSFLISVKVFFMKKWQKSNYLRKKPKCDLVFFISKELNLALEMA